jgi:hypothetical protein
MPLDKLVRMNISVHNALSSFIVVLYRDDYISLFVTCFDIPMSTRAT